MCSSAAPREAFTSTTSAAATFSRTQASASSRPAVGTVSPRHPGTAAAPSAMPYAGRPTATTTSTPASAATRPTSMCAASASSPSSFISPSTATVRRERRRPISVSASIAAAMDAGLAL